jgi:hypothetical protein
MAFDYDNAVQQGFNRDIDNNDWNVEARNLEVILEDANGATEVRVVDAYGVKTFEAHSDGYVGAKGEVHVHGGLVKVVGATSQDFPGVTITDIHDETVGLYTLDGDPNGTVSGFLGSLGMDHSDGYLYINNDGATSWTRLVGEGETVLQNLQQTYKADDDGSDATITTDATDGWVVIAGDQGFRVTATQGFDLDTGFDMDGAGPFDVDITGAVSIDADSASNFTVDSANLTLSTTTSGTVTVDGVDGVTLDGNGNDVIPATDDTDSLGDSTHGWTTVYLRNIGDTATIALNAVGGAAAPNTTAGADTVGTNDTNFDTFGFLMDRDSVQGALEAIDGYFEDYIWPEFDNITLQRAYDNDPDGGNATITTNATDGAVVIAGDQKLQVTATGGIDLDTGFDMDGAGPFDVDITGAVSIDADSASNFSVDGADLTLSTTTAGDVNVVSVADVDIDATSAVTIDASANSNFTVDGANLTLATTTSGDVLVSIPDGTGDFKVSDGTNEYIETFTNLDELRLGDDAYGQEVLVRVRDDLVVEGDLYVNGDETILNTEQLYVEDRLIRLNIGAAPGFSGTTGIEMELGSDGYAEFHWDDTQARWEISIDRSATPENQTFRPLPYLADGAATLDLSDTGTDGFPTAGPNPDAGASVINTNTTNFPNTFGPDMTDNSVQAALEAIDGYFVELSDEHKTFTTLQIAYDNDADGGDATITTNATDGAVVIAGDQKLQVTATGGIDLDTGFDMDGAGPFDVDITGAVSIDSDAASNFTVDGANLTLSTTTTGTVTVDGVDGVTLDGNGNNVIPATDDTDSLGDSTHGWTTVYLRNVGDTTTVALNAAGAVSAENNTSGAETVGTNDTNFDTFGSLMTRDSVQGALEAIDGYLQDLADQVGEGVDSVTLQVAYDNDVDGGDATITTNATDGAVVIAGDQKFQVTATNGFDLDTQFDMDGAGPFDVDITGGASIDADSASNFTVDGGTLTLSTTTSGNLIINSSDALDIDADSVTIDTTAGGSISLDADASSNISTTTGTMTVDGAGGVILDGNGSNVIPALDDTDSLGSSTNGWTTVYLRNIGDTATIALNAVGGAGAPNTNAGADAVGTNDTNFLSFGPLMTRDSVQGALEAIDGYFRDLSLEDLDTTFTNEQGLELGGAVLNGNVRVSSDSGTPALDFTQAKTGRASWTVPVPSDWDGVSDINVEVVWSAEDSSVGNVLWRLEYKALSLTELASGASTTDDYTQATSGTADELQSTGTNLSISAGDIQAGDDIIVMNIVRRGTAGGDTYSKKAQVHLVKYTYTAQNIV